MVEESTRASREAVQFFIEPAAGTLARAKSRRHHIIFGRRGSGKSSLLRKIHADHLLDRIPSAMVDLEDFKAHSYPDVLISVLIKTLSELQVWLDTAAVSPASKSSFWHLFSKEKPSNARMTKAQVTSLSSVLEREIEQLNILLHAPDTSESTAAAKISTVATREAETSGGISLKAPTLDLNGGLKGKFGSTNEATRDVRTSYTSKKIETLSRNIMRYKQVLGDFAQKAGGDIFILLDDLYHIRLSDQADVIDYFHRLAKGQPIRIKVGTIKHRSRWYLYGDPPRGMKIGDDTDEIDLDVTLERYATAKEFLLKILGQFAQESGVKLEEIMTDGARDRLVLASGGVARDFLTLFRRALDETRDRVFSGDLARGDRIGAEDVNKAAGAYYDNKTEELKRDTGEAEGQALLGTIEKIRKFCVDETNANCFLVEKDLNNDLQRVVLELVDLKFLHHARSRVTIRNREGKVYDAFMLDLSFYTGERKRRELDMIEFWKSGEELRSSKLIYAEKEITLNWSPSATTPRKRRPARRK